MLLFCLSILYAACSKHVCIYPQNNSINFILKPLHGTYTAIGFGGSGMKNSEMIVIHKSGKDYKATGYYSKDHTPRPNGINWTIHNLKVTRNRVYLTVTGPFEGKSPKGNFIWAIGKFKNKKLGKHGKGNYGTIKI
jgi:hypothetical protein